MILWPEYKLCILGVPRTASTAMHTAMMDAGAKGLAGQHQWPSKRYPQSLVIRQHGWRTAVVVREHVDWWRSYYDYHPHRDRELTISWVRKHQATGTWRETYRWPRASRWLFAPYLQYASDIMYFEDLQDDFDALLASVGAPRIELPVVNISVKRTEMPEDVAEYIRGWYSLERELLGYTDAKAYTRTRKHLGEYVRRGVGKPRRGVRSRRT